MALGGGIWAVQNKVLPGTYINFSSVAKASATLSDRGYAAMPLMLDWGPDGTVFTVTSGDFQKNSLKIFGHAYTDDALLPLRELFQYTQTLYAYRLNGGGAKAACTYCTAKYSGVAGNKLYVVIAANADNSSLFDVSLYYDTTLLDTQPVAAAHQAALDKFESYSFNTLGCPSDDSTTIKLYINYTKRLRDEVGAKLQTVIFNLDSNEKLADYEGVIEIGSKVTDYDSGISGLGQYGLVYWMTGASAGCAVNKSNTNKKYDGELTVDVDRTQAELEAAIKAGRLMFHNVNGDVRILEDIDSLITVSDTKGDVFKSNQTIRVCDQIANDTAVLFNTRYLGTVPNDAAGRIALWNDICKLHQDLESIRAIEDFDPDSVTVEQGDTKKAVLCTVKDLNVVNAMAQLYMSVIIM